MTRHEQLLTDLKMKNKNNQKNERLNKNSRAGLWYSGLGVRGLSYL